MKKKKIYILILLLTLSVSVSAGVILNANQVSYNNKTVEETLNDLYNKVNTLIDFDGTISYGSNNCINVTSGKKYVINVSYYLDNCAGAGYPYTSNISISGANIESQSPIMYHNTRCTDGGLYCYGQADRTYVVTASNTQICSSISRTSDSNSNAIPYISAVQID